MANVPPEHGWEYAVYEGLRFRYAPIQGDFFVGYARATTKPYREVVDAFYDFASQWYHREMLTWIPHDSPWILYGWTRQSVQATTISYSYGVSETDSTSAWADSSVWVGWSAPTDTVATDIATAVPVEAHPRQLAFDALEEAVAKAVTPNWDGYDAPPITVAAKSEAIRFLGLLGPDIPNPEITLAPGAITFDWYNNPRWIFSVSVADNRRVHYAGLFGSAKMSGPAELTGALPEIIDFGIRRAVGGPEASH
jgi:hypothetical protein